MPQITKISAQKKAKRFNVFLNDDYAFSVSEFSLLEYGLKQGKTLSLDQIDKITSKEKSSIYLDFALRQLAIRPRSEKEMTDYLQKKIAARDGVKFQEAKNNPVIRKIIAKLKKYEYLDDKKFASWFLKSKLKTKQESLRLIKYQLKQKGIPQPILDKFESNKPRDLKNAIKAAEKKVERWKKLPTLEYKKKFYQFLAYRGFDFETISEAFAFYRNKR